MIYAALTLIVVFLFYGWLLNRQFARERQAWTVERQRLINLAASRTPAEFSSLQRSSAQPAAVDPHERTHPFVRKPIVKASDIPTPWDESDQMPAVLPIGL